MNETRLPRFVRRLLAAGFLVALSAAPAAAQTEIVLHTKNATRVQGDWQQVADSSAASGVRMWNPDRGAAKLTSPAASPIDFFELTFTVEAYRPYRLWIRGKADNNAWTNDSVFVQFTNTVDKYDRPVDRIGTTDAAIVSVEACSGCGVSGWGWEDNAYGADGPVIYFITGGEQTIRVQRREDGVSIDQILLSPWTYYYAAPGGTKNDATILPATSTTANEPSPSPEPAPAPAPAPAPGGSDIVLTASHATAARGNWRAVSDSSAATGTRYWIPDAGLPKLSSAYASPADYVDLTFTAEAGRAYRLWMRGKADSNAYTNDSAFVQFTGSVNSSGAPVFRVGTTDATIVSIEDCSGCGLSGWGWSDNGYASWGPLIYFSTTGTQTLRVQRREDGMSFDQIVLSAQAYLSSAPGSTKNDTTILAPTTTTTTAPAPEPEPAPAPAPEPAPTGAVRMRVLQWNLHHSVGTDGVYDLNRIATWMASLKPDVILLNEVEKNTWWGYEDQPARYKALLEQKTGRRWYSHFSQEYGQWSSNGKGHQILSIYPLDSVSHVPITPSSGLGGGGVASQATIHVNGRTVNFVLTHLDPYDPAMRLTQAKDVIRWASGFAENRILAGDMNAWPDQASIHELYKAYADSWDVARAKGTAYASSSITPYGATKKGRIDYILFSKGAPNLVVVESQVYDTRDSSGVMPSDHRPVVTTFEVR